MFTVLIGALLFGYFLTITQSPQKLTEFLTSLGIGRYGVLALIMLMYLVLGCLMDAMAMIILTVPIIFPVIVHLGFDPIWFGVIIVMTVELGLIHPPVGMNVFVIKSVVKDVSFTTIFKGVLPFILTDIVPSGHPDRLPDHRAVAPDENELMSIEVIYTVRVEFGDCDPAGIVWFPNFFRWIDAASRHFFAERGVPRWEETAQTLGVIGTPLVDTHTRFVKSASYGDTLQHRRHHPGVARQELRAALPRDARRRPDPGMRRSAHLRGEARGRRHPRGADSAGDPPALRTGLSAGHDQLPSILLDTCFEDARGGPTLETARRARSVQCAARCSQPL